MTKVDFANSWLGECYGEDWPKNTGTTLMLYGSIVAARQVDEQTREIKTAGGYTATSKLLPDGTWDRWRVAE